MSSEKVESTVKSSHGRDFLLAAIAVVGTLAFGEVAVRFILPPPFKIATRKISRGQGMPRFAIDPEIGWVNEPSDETYRFQAPGRYGKTDAIYHMHQGLRDTPPAAASDPIIVTTGCSFTYGFGVNDADSWPWLLGEHMPDYHVINVATSAYGVNQALMRAERFESQTPGKVKMILYGFADFHVDRDRAHQRDLMSLYPTGRPRILKEGDGTKDIGLVHFWTPGKLLEHSNLLMHVVNHVAEIANKTPGEEDSREISVRLLRDFAKRCETKKIAFAVIVLPHGSDRGPYSTRTREFLVTHLQEAGVKVLVPEFPRNPDGNIDRRQYLIPSDEFHPNRAYNVILADAVSKYVKADVMPAAASPSPTK